MTEVVNSSKDNLPLAIVVIVVTVMVLALGDALIKKTSADLVLWQIFVLRSLPIIPVLFLIRGIWYARVSLKPQALGWTILRSLMLAMMWVLYYAALPHLSLSVAAAAYYTLPLFITLFSAWFIGDKVSLQGWFAIILGFCGVIVILRPATDAFNAYALLPLVSAMLYAFAMILTRTRCRHEHPLVLSTALNFTFIFIGLAATGVLSAGSTAVDTTFLSPHWQTPGQSELLAIVLLAIAILVGSIGTAIAYQSGKSSIVATFDFSYVGFAVIFGYMLFDDLPDLTTMGGIVMIVVSGVLAVRQ